MNTNQLIQARRGFLTSLRWSALLAVVAFSGSSCSSSSGPDDPPPANLSGFVSNPAGTAVVGAKVYLVPSAAVPTDPITGAGVLAQSTLDIDEPLEDAVATLGSTFPQATTDANGSYNIATVPDGRYFLYVEPAAGDQEHFAGGSLCRTSADADSFRASRRDVVLSSSPPANATYTGMTGCLVCHPDYATEKTLAHRLGFRVPGVSSPLQDTSEHPEIDEGLAYFLATTVYSSGTPVYMYDYDASRGFDKYKASLSDPGGSGVVSFILWLWKDTGTNEHKITMENVGNVGDPRNFETRVVKLTYGGAVYKQRYMIDWVDEMGDPRKN